MPQYHWKGIDQKGNPHKGKYTTNSIPQLKQELLKKNIALLSCKPHKLIPLKSISQPQLTSFFQDLSIILDSGITLINALELTQKCTNSKKLSLSIPQLINHVEQGTPFSQAMAENNMPFSPLMIQLAYSGEQANNLPQALKQLANYLTQKHSANQKLQQAALLPSITLVFALSILATIILFVVPQFAPLLALQGKRPFILNLNNILQAEYTRIIIVTFLAGTLLLIKYAKKIPHLAPWKDKYILHIPIIGKTITLINLLHFTKTFSLLISSGNTIKASLLQAGKTCTNTHIARKLASATADLEHGQSLHQALSSTTLRFPPFFLTALALGEQTGKLETMLNKNSQLLEKKLMARIHVLTTVFQPLMLLTVGGLIAFLLLSLYMPIFELPQFAG